jgi:predicted small lipoprotein YifL
MSKKVISMTVVLAMSAGLAGCASSTPQHWTPVEKMGRDMIRATRHADNKYLREQRNKIQEQQMQQQDALEGSSY